MGRPLSVPLDAGEFRWRPYGYAERGWVPDRDAPDGRSPGPVIVALLSPDIDPETVARQSGRGSRWATTQAWRETMDPQLAHKRWGVFGISAGIVLGAVAFLLAVRVIPGLWALGVPVLIGVATAFIVSMAGEKRAQRRINERRSDPNFAAVQIAITGYAADNGYAKMLTQFDQVAEAWGRGRVLDQSWQDVRNAVIVAAWEYAEHNTPADKSNYEWVRAMQILDSVRTDLGVQGLG